MHALRYPSGVIYNPNGESNVEDAFTVVAGPSHLNGTWDHTYHGSAQLNNSNFTDYYYPWESENDWARSSMTVVTGAVYNFGQDLYNNWCKRSRSNHEAICGCIYQSC